MSKSKSNSELNEKITSLKDAAERFASDASPKISEAVEQVTDVAEDLYSRASSWLKEDRNRTTGVVALVAVAGVFGFFLGRGARARDHLDQSG